MDRMSAARAVSREEKLILRMASITGRASKAVTSTCSMGSASSSALRVRLGGRHRSLRLLQYAPRYARPRRAHRPSVARGTFVRPSCHVSIASPTSGSDRARSSAARGRTSRPWAASPPRTVSSLAKAVEAGSHGDAIGAQHADLDVVALADVVGQPERSRHDVERIAGRARRSGTAAGAAPLRRLAHAA